MEVVTIPVLKDNYSYLIYESESRLGVVVDGVDASKVAGEVQRHQVKLEYILTTHKHADHAGGNAELHVLFPQVPIVGGLGEEADAVNQEVKHDEVLYVGNMTIRVFSTPCHTSGHVLYLIEKSNEKALLTGDTLFVGGCGRFFEGTAAQMHEALNTTVASLPESTKVYCGHDYTVNNLLFAASVEPDNTDITAKLEWARMQNKQGLATVPSTIGEEKRTNPFMRVTLPHVEQYTKTKGPIETMTALRQRKNMFGIGSGK